MQLPADGDPGNGKRTFGHLVDTFHDARWIHLRQPFCQDRRIDVPFFLWPREGEPILTIERDKFDDGSAVGRHQVVIKRDEDPES